MTKEKAIRVLEQIEYYLKTHTNESCEEEHSAITIAKKAIRIVEVTENCFKHNRGEGLIDSDDWEDIKKFVEQEVENNVI